MRRPPKFSDSFIRSKKKKERRNESSPKRNRQPHSWRRRTEIVPNTLETDMFSQGYSAMEIGARFRYTPSPDMTPRAMLCPQSQKTISIMPAKKRVPTKDLPVSPRQDPRKETSRFRFSGHQTFVPRNGWLEKGVGLIRQAPSGFLADDAVVRLGVGKNMVESIKYWCLQTGLIEDAETTGEMRIAELGRFLFGDEERGGADPFLEDDASLWLLHHHICTAAQQSSWSLAFNHWNKPEFTKDELSAFIARKLGDAGASVSENTLKRDVDCFLRAHAGTGNAGEESFDSPFPALRLIHATSTSGLYRFNIGRKHNLPDDIVGFAILRFMEDTGGDLNVSLNRLLFDPGSPGQVFKLDRGALVDAVLSLGERRNGKLSYSDTAGLETVRYAGDRTKLRRDSESFLRKHFGKEGPR